MHHYWIVRQTLNYKIIILTNSHFLLIFLIQSLLLWIFLLNVHSLFHLRRWGSYSLNHRGVYYNTLSDYLVPIEVCLVVVNDLHLLTLSSLVSSHSYSLNTLNYSNIFLRSYSSIFYFLWECSNLMRCYFLSSISMNISLQIFLKSVSNVSSINIIIS